MESLILVAGPRSLLAVSGAATLVGGVWYVDRTWDEKGSAAYARAAKEVGAGDKVEISKKDLDDAFPFPAAFLLGWVLFAASYFFPTDGGFRVEFSASGLIASGFSLALSFIASIPMGDALRNRNAQKKQMLGMLFVLSWLGLTLSSGQSTANGGISYGFCGLGAVLIIMSMKILWKNRKMGDSWEQFGKPNPNPVVYNLGGPLFIFGWFLFILGMAATTVKPDADVISLTVHLNWRTALAFFAGCGMVPVVMFLDYAHDEGAKFVGFGTDGRYFGRFLESPIPFLIMWTLFGLAVFLPVEGNKCAMFPTYQWIILANCIGQGVVAGVLIQTALYKEDMATKNKWSIVFVALFMSLAWNLGRNGSIALGLAFPGAVLVIMGQKTVFGDRKRGDYFMQNHANNPNPIVYSVGEPLFMAGWILLSWSMSCPL